MFVREESGTHLGFLGGVVSQAAWNDHGVVGVLDEPKVQDGVCKLPKGRAEVVRSPHPDDVSTRTHALWPVLSGDLGGGLVRGGRGTV